MVLSNYSRSGLKRIAFIYVIVIALLVSPYQSAHALTIEDISYNAMNFGTPNLVSGTALSVGSVYKYTNVYSTTVDAKVTVVEKSANATLVNIDNDKSNINRFNPIMSTNNSVGEGYVNFKIEFVDKSGDPASLKNFFMTVVDLDGNNSIREYNEVSGYKSYIVNNPNRLTIGPGDNGRTRFTGLLEGIGDIPFRDDNSFVANYSAPISSLNVVIGVTGASSGNREASINFGATVDTYSTPETIENPSSPTISVSIDDGGDGFLKPGVDDLTAVPISGTTTAGVGQTVAISVTDSAGHTSNFSATVQADGTYSLTPNISSLAGGTLTVTANVVSMDGNPASPASVISAKDSAPTGTSVSITGTAKVGETLTGAYTYGDVDGDLQGTSTFKWYSGTNSNGSDKAVISGATSQTYDVTNTQYGKYLFFEVTPVAATGTPTGTAVLSSVSAQVGDAAPTATSVSITGTAKVGETVTGAYTYGDVDGDLQGTSTFKWYSGTNSNGSDKAVISGATSQTYEVAHTQYGKYLFFEVTPVAATGTPTGTAVLSSASGQVVDVAPTATSVSITGTAKVGETVTGAYTYGDVDGDLQGTSTFKWYSGTNSDGSDKTVISGATSQTYVVTNTQYDKYLYFEVTPAAATGTPTGTAVLSSASGQVVDVAPTASSVSVTGSPVVGQTLTGTYTYGDVDGDSQGTSTFKWYSGTLSNGSDKAAIAGATSQTYEVMNTQYGKYLFFEVTPVAATGTPTGTPAVSGGFKVNTRPVVNEITKTGLAGAVISFSSADFSVNSAYSDSDEDPLTHVQLTLPNTFDTKGTLWYEVTVTDAVYIAQGTTSTLTTAQLNSLKFMPESDLPNGSTVTFDWKGEDGKEYSALSSLVKIIYNGVPIAQSLDVSAEEGTPSISITLSGTDMETVTGMVYGIASSPSKGTLVLDPSDNPNGDKWIYTPTVGKTGMDSFTYTVTDSDGQVSRPATVDIEINKQLEGWTGNKIQGDTTVVNAIPGYALKLSAVSSLPASEVNATVNGNVVSLTLVNSATMASDGYKKWEIVDYLLPVSTTPGEYTVTFTASKADDSLLPAESVTKLNDNKFKISEAAILTLNAVPAKIIGDGISTTLLTALITDADGNPIANTEVVFSSTPGIGTFVGPPIVLTDINGKASVTYKSDKITDTTEIQIPVKVTVLDMEKGISAQDQIIVTFLPPVISGILTKGGTHEAIGGASIRVTLDMNGDGIIESGVDFDETVITNPDGSYSVPVPEGDRDYTLAVTQTVTIGGVDTDVSFEQVAKVGVVSGTGDKFESEKTATGVVLFKNPDGQTSLFKPEVINNIKVYLKDSLGSYIMEGGIPKAFDLQGQGVFQATGLAKDVIYTMEIKYELAPGEEIIMKQSQVKVNDDGEMNISEELVDPYGTIRDRDTNSIIVGAQVMLYYADTTRNTGKGRVPNTGVVLPAVPGFAPYDNRSPEQLSDSTGFYAYMVYPETDYYLVVKKDGYRTERSETISVEFDIVKRDFYLVSNSGDGSSPGGSVVTALPSVTLDISSDANLVKESQSSIITIDYKNLTEYTLEAGEITVTIPSGVELLDTNGGTVDGNKITWKISGLKPGGTGSYDIKVKWPLLTAAEADFEFPGEFIDKGHTTLKANSNVKVKVFSDRFGQLQHQRYIIGYPDGMFKPNNLLTRAEIAAVVARLTENDKMSTPLSYSDVTEGHWAANYIKIVTKHGYFDGFVDGKFYPESPVTRGELASIMASFLKLDISKRDDMHFSDIGSYWAADAIEALYRNHFLAGYPDGTFKPNDKISRVEAVILINRMLYRGPLKGIDSIFPDVPASHWGSGDVLEATFSHESTRNEDGSETWSKKIEDHVQ